MATKILKQRLNGVTLLYAIRDDVTTFSCVPFSKEKDVKDHRLLKNDSVLYGYVDPVTQVALSGDGVQRDFSAGYTLFNSDTSFSFKLVDQKREEDAHEIIIKTLFENQCGLKLTQIVKQVKPYTAFETYMVLENNGLDVSVDKISSFMIGALSPFQNQNDPSSIVLHRIKNYWSMESRLISQTFEDLQFEDSWAALGIKVERIGATGMMPARGYIPFIAVEDKKENVTWAIQLETQGSWQIEAIHKCGSVSINGGIADFNYGHWNKILKHGEKFITPKAFISVTEGDLTLSCAELTKYQNTLIKDNYNESDLPVIFNEYLLTWGNPSIELFKTLIPLAKKIGCDYFVCDSGWYSTDSNWVSIGDWEINKKAFPNGLKEFSNIAFNNNMKACGIWYEFEGVTDSSKVFKEHPDWVLTLNNKPIHRANRYLLDFRKPEVINYLSNKVINNLKENSLNYIKVDYNEDVGIGCDGAESIGEGLRQHSIAVHDFFKKMKEEIPELIIESCSSGGMRHSIDFDTIGSMCSFSDNHECLSGATIAIDSHRFIQPRIMQIWASLLPAHSINEIYFTLIKGMLGRMCVSGPIDKIGEEKLAIAKRGIEFYKQITNVIKNGRTILIDTDETKSILKPSGVNKLIRMSDDGKEMVVYIFSYGVPSRTIEVDNNGYKLVSHFGNCVIKNEHSIELLNNDICAEVLLYKR